MKNKLRLLHNYGTIQVDTSRIKHKHPCEGLVKLLSILKLHSRTQVIVKLQSYLSEDADESSGNLVPIKLAINSFERVDMLTDQAAA